MLTVKTKIFIARMLSGSLRGVRRLAGLGMKTVARRKGVEWELDLDEGIDLSIYVLGAYEPRSLRAYQRVIRPGQTVFDIGANIGAHTLHFARLVGPEGRVFAFEPTDFALGKLRRNLARNPALARHVSVQQSFLQARADAPLPAAVPASWPVGGWHDDLHWGHLGRSKPLDGARSLTADAFCAVHGLARLDFVKLDVDGHEHEVLRGFTEGLHRFRPFILVEFAPFVYQGEKAGEFDGFVRLLSGLGYAFFSANNRRPIPRDPADLRRTIVAGGGINALLVPPGREPG